LTLATQDEAIDSHQDEALELTRAALQSAIKAYTTTSYISESSAGSVYAKEGVVTIAISGEKTNLRNFWSGKWHSTWPVKVADGKATVSGNVQVCIFIYICIYIVASMSLKLILFPTVVPFQLFRVFTLSNRFMCITLKMVTCKCKQTNTSPPRRSRLSLKVNSPAKLSHLFRFVLLLFTIGAFTYFLSFFFCQHSSGQRVIVAKRIGRNVHKHEYGDI
jgi:hypothetical protein